jgi:hypothetical protein
MKSKNNPATKAIESLILFIALFIIFVVLAGTVAFILYPNLNGIGGILLSLMCAAPLAIFLFVRFKMNENNKWYKTYILPALIFPFLMLLFLGWTAFEQRPVNIFKVFVAEPMPTGVSNIQARDVSLGIDQTIILGFNATPTAIDEIIATNKLTLSKYEEPDTEFKIFTGIGANEKWTTYNFDNGKIDITMWVNPERNTALFRWFDF